MQVQNLSWFGEHLIGGPQVQPHHRRSLLSFSSLSAQELVDQHKACDAATKDGPYTYTRARRAWHISLCSFVAPTVLKQPPSLPTASVLLHCAAALHVRVILLAPSICDTHAAGLPLRPRRLLGLAVKGHAVAGTLGGA